MGDVEAQEIQAKADSVLHDIGVQIDPSTPDYLADYQRVVGENADLYVSSSEVSETNIERANILGQEALAVQNMLGLDHSSMSKAILVVGNTDQDTPDDYHIAAAYKVQSDGLLTPIVYIPEYRFSFGGERSIPALLRHEYLHSVDDLLGNGNQTFSELFANQIAAKVIEAFPELGSSYGDDEFEDILSEMKHGTSPTADDLYDSVGEGRVLTYKPFVGHPKDSVREFVVSILNTVCDNDFGQSLQAKPPALRAKIQHIHNSVLEMARARTRELGLSTPSV